MPIKLSVNCWFCNSTNYVSFFKRNSWYCTSCEQYNGFTKNGDYNKEIPEMYQTQPPPSTTTTTSKYKNKQQIHKSTNCLCDKCNLNQEIKLFRLREYQNQLKKANNNDLNDDLNSSDFNINDVEVNLYKEYLDKIYDLCDNCKSKVKFEIRKQDGILKEYLYKLGNFKYFFEQKTVNQMKKVKLPSMGMSKIVANLFVLLVSVAVISLYALNSYKIIDFSYGFMTLSSAYFINVLLFTSNYEPIDLIILFVQYISMYLHYTNHFFVNFQHEFQLVLAQIVVCTCVMVKLLFYNRRKNVNVIKQTTVNAHRPHSDTIYDQNYFSKPFSNTNLSKKSTKSSFSLIQPPKFNYQNDADHKFASFNSNNRLAYALSLPDKSMFKREEESLNGNAGDTDDDDSSSIISGMTNLYLEKSNRMKSCNSFDSSNSMSTLASQQQQQQQHKANQFYSRSFFLLSMVTVIINTSIVGFLIFRLYSSVKAGA